MTQSGGRVYGLDIFRSLAVLFVLWGHTLEHSQPPEWARLLGRLGGVGVELFFVLSGFLIGGILIDLIDKGRLTNLREARAFWMRRWLRTLPMYFFALVAFLRLDYLGRHNLMDYPSYWVFMQNFAWPIGQFFGISWSLTIEEHFYLWFPLIFLGAGLATRNARLAFWMAIAALFAVVIAYRLSLPRLPDYDAFNYRSRMVVLAHLDGIGAGVAVAALKRWRPTIFQTIARLAPFWALACAALWVWYLIGLPGIERRVVQLWMKTVEAVILAGLLPWFARLEIAPRTGVAAFFEMTSRLSYSLYLNHILVIVLTHKLLSRVGVFEGVYAVPIIIYPLYFTGYYVASWMTYHLVEKRFLDLREGAFAWMRVARAIWPTALAVGAMIVLL